MLRSVKISQLLWKIFIWVWDWIFFFFNFTGFGLILYFFPPISGVALILSADDTITQCTTKALDQIFLCWFWLNFLLTLDLVCYFLLIFWRQNSIRLVVWTCFSKREFKKKKKWRIKINVSLFCISIIFHNHISLFKV